MKKVNDSIKVLKIVNSSRVLDPDYMDENLSAQDVISKSDPILEAGGKEVHIYSDYNPKSDTVQVYYAFNNLEDREAMFSKIVSTAKSTGFSVLKAAKLGDGSETEEDSESDGYDFCAILKIDNSEFSGPEDSDKFFDPIDKYLKSQDFETIAFSD